MPQTEDERALLLASGAGFRVLQDGYVCPPSIGQSMRDLLLAYYQLIRRDMVEDDGK